MSNRFKLGQENIKVFNDGSVILKRYHDHGSRGWKPIKGMPPIVSLEACIAYIVTDDRLNAKIIWATNSKVAGMVMQHKYLQKCLLKFCLATGSTTPI
jgi:hypothetical protein